MKSVYRVNYYIGGVPVTKNVCASSPSEAADFVGVRDGSAQVNALASNVEVVGVDKPYAAIAGPAINYAPPEAPKQLSDVELAKLRAILAKA